MFSVKPFKLGCSPKRFGFLKILARCHNISTAILIYFKEINFYRMNFQEWSNFRYFARTNFRQWGHFKYFARIYFRELSNFLFLFQFFFFFLIKKDIKCIRMERILKKLIFVNTCSFTSYQTEITFFIIILQFKFIHHHFLHWIHQKCFHLHLCIPTPHGHQRNERHTYLILSRTLYHRLPPTNH